MGMSDDIMSDAQAKAWKILGQEYATIREVIASSQAVVADLIGNADDRRRGSYVLVDADRVDRLVAAVNTLDRIDLNPQRKPRIRRSP
jgi:hypothetical protein